LDENESSVFLQAPSKKHLLILLFYQVKTFTIHARPK